MVFLFQLKLVSARAEKTFTFDALAVIMPDSDKQKFKGPMLKSGKLLGEVVSDFISKNKISLKSVTASQLKKLNAAVGDNIYKVYVSPNLTENKK